MMVERRQITEKYVHGCLPCCYLQDVWPLGECEQISFSKEVVYYKFAAASKPQEVSNFLKRHSINFHVCAHLPDTYSPATRFKLLKMPSGIAVMLLCSRCLKK